MMCRRTTLALAAVLLIAATAPAHAGRKAKRIAALEAHQVAVEAQVAELQATVAHLAAAAAPDAGRVTRGSSSPATGLGAITPTADDLLYVVDDPAGTPTSKKATVGSLATPLAADFLKLDSSNDPLTAELEISAASGAGQLVVNSDDGVSDARLRLRSNGVTVGMLSVDPSGNLMLHSGGATARAWLDSAGKMGIGASSPAAQLDVLSTTEQFRIQYDATNYWTDTTATDGGRTVAGFGTDADFAISFAGATDGDFLIDTPGFVYDSSTARVGIGTAAPGSPLHVTTAASANVIFAETTDVDSIAAIRLDNDARSWGIQNRGTTADAFVVRDRTGTTDPFTIEAAAPSNSFYIDSAGDVGIGTATPDGPLHIFTASAGTVTANANGDDLVVEGSTNPGISVLMPDIEAGSLLFGTPTSNIEAYLSWDSNADQMTMATKVAGASMLFETGSSATALTIDSSQDATFAQAVTITDILTITPKATAPATCAIGDFYVDTSGAACACSATNTWSNMHATGTCA